MKFASLCSGIEAASVAWAPLGWEAVAFSEIAPFPSAVLAHHYSAIPNLGDLNEFATWPLRQPDVVIGGTPCQSFSLAGKRGGLEDQRGRLMFAFLGVVERERPRWVVWENVPGVLSSNGGRDFGTFLGSLGQLGYGWAYRVLDAQWFGVPQRRRRVFVVAHSGADVRRAGAVLFESESLRRDSAPSREEGQGDTGSTGNGLARCLTTGEMKRSDWETCNFVACFQQNYRSEVRFIGGDGALTGALTNAPGAQQQNYIYSLTPGENCASSRVVETDVSTTLKASRSDDRGIRICQASRIRRLTATECERLQGFPDGYTAIEYRGKPAADSPRIAALGNSMAVPVIRWIGERIEKNDN